MMSELDLQQYSVRTDLALEAKEIAEQGGEALQGVSMTTMNDHGIQITRLTVENEQGSQAIGKMIGNYVTLEVPGLRKQDTELQDRVATHFAKQFELFLQQTGVSAQAKALIVGLGNWNVTPDALGPIVVENVMITRHFFELMPDEVAPGYRPVSAVSPGVLGITGIESSDIIKGIVEQSKPDFIVAIDALASKAIERVNTTIQISDTGIHPGSGIGNKRRGITKEIMGVPVIAIGVPTVMFASTIVNNCIELMQKHFQTQTSNTGQILGLLDSMEEHERLTLVKEILSPMGHDLLVTPKEVDEFIEDIGNIIASGLNAALHDAVDSSNVAAYTH
ncbi:GPR endopeptidase [Paenibacillus sp. SYP-B4298]|uniref:GPR endopeptidase n=1 Tax=Paenibacillus sp. SYP-B4298 TaxID=2996034 RepID=UPI003FA6A636